MHCRTLLLFRQLTVGPRAGPPPARVGLSDLPDWLTFALVGIGQPRNTAQVDIGPRKSPDTSRPGSQQQPFVRQFTKMIDLAIRSTPYGAFMRAIAASAESPGPTGDSVPRIAPARCRMRGSVDLIHFFFVWKLLEKLHRMVFNSHNGMRAG